MSKQKTALLTTVILIFVTFATAFFITFGFGARGFAAAEESNACAATVTFGDDITEYDSIAQAWAYADSLATTEKTPAVITLLGNATTTDTLTVEQGKYITLNLDGYMLKKTGGKGSVITVNGNFTLSDGDAQSEHLFKIANDGRWLFDDGYNKQDNDVHIHHGGAITGGTGRSDGGAINQGGGVYVAAGGAFAMENGAICGNTATNEGGGVYVASDGTFTMENGAICGNFSYWYGGVYVGGSFEISGATIITSNKVNGKESNVYLPSGKAIAVTGALEKEDEKAQIGVTLASGTGVCTTGYGTHNSAAPRTYFTSDDDSYAIALSGGQAELATPIATVAVDGDDAVKCGSVEDAFTYADSLTTTEKAPAVITLLDNATTTGTLTVEQGKYITLNLDGYMLKKTGGKGSVITVNGNFTLKDSNTDTTKTHTITSPVTNQEVTIIGGLITGGKGNGSEFTYGGGVYVSGTFNMNGGTIAGNSTRLGGGGGGVYVCNGGIFNMDSGNIRDNSGEYGGGVFVEGGAFYMSGGEISGNEANSFGGGVYVKQASGASNAQFTMTGGKIVDNVVSIRGGGVAISDGAFTISGAVTIADNKVNGNANNVYLQSGKTIAVAGALAEGAKIGVYNNGDIATGYSQSENPSKYFVCDNSAYNCIYVSDKATGTVTIGEHDYSNEWTTDKNSHWHACTRCGAKNDEDGHTAGDAATCTTAQTCTECAYQIEAALGHDFSGEFVTDDDGHWHVCSRDGCEVTDTKENHNTVTDKAVAATCTASGKTEGSHCSVCGMVLQAQTTIAALGHTLVHNPAIPATNDKDGNIEYWDCEECEKIFSDEDGNTEITDKSSVVLPKLSGGKADDYSALWITLLVVLSTIILFELWLIISRKTHHRRKGDK